MIKQRKSQAEFAWLFSLIIGAMILFLAIFFAGKVFQTGTSLTQAETLRTFDVLLNPFSSAGNIVSLTLSKSIEMPYQTELNFSCSDTGEKLSLRTIEKKNGEWTSYTIKNKYLFANSSIQGKKFWTFSKPFELPWRIDDMIYIIPETERYCFVDLSIPSDIKTELGMINSTVINMVGSIAQCEDAKTVCFITGDCDIQIHYSNYYLTKKGVPGQFYFGDDASMYAAIFSSKQIYDCNIKRLLSRLPEQAGIYYNLANKLNSEGCGNNGVLSQLASFKDKTWTYISNDLITSSNRIKEADSYSCLII